MIGLVNRILKSVPTSLVYLVGAGWVVWLFWQGATGQLGPEPIKALEHAYGQAALILLIAGLTVTPARRHIGLNLIRFRRAFGLVAMMFVVCHLLVWAALDLQSVARVWADIFKRPYITLGLTAFVLLVPLAATSNDRAVRWMGRKWRQLHRLTYPAVLLAGLHFLMLRKGLQLEPVLYLTIIVVLLLFRLPGLMADRKAV